MSQIIQPYEVQPRTVQSLQVTPQSFQVVMGIIVTVWAGAWVFSQIVKMAKGEEVKKPPLLP